MSAVQKFKAEAFPLEGRRLIEASAGTGKTYNIANLYLRLVVGDGCAPKTVGQILVVTFTRAATSELRGRIREKIEQALHAFRDAECKDDFILGLLHRTEEQNKENSARLLTNALLLMDEACIFTIHGFSVRAIQTFLFETGALADVEISEAGNIRKEQLLADIWRQLQLSDNQNLLSYADALDCKNASQFSDYFQKNIDPADITPVFSIGDPARDLPELLDQLDAYVDHLFGAIMDVRNELLIRWEGICNKEGVSAIKQVLGDSGNSKLFEKIDSLLRSEQGKLALPTGKMLERMMTIHDSDARDDLACLIRDFVAHISSSAARETFMRNGFRALLLQYINARMSESDLSSMQLDEVINLINGILREGDRRASQLRDVITGTYPVCMVDEFQDTDPAQFEMFSRLYEAAEHTGFFMIGDPKQSIYQFRGADIFSYLNVRAQVQQQEKETGQQHIYSLDTNFRSKSALIKATNQLFAEGQNKTFLFHGIDYVNVNSCEDYPFSLQKGEYTVTDKSITNKPLVFIGNDADVNDSDVKFNGDTLHWKYAKDTAQRIAALLDAKKGGKIKKDSQEQRSVCGGDIAVLVRTAKEASAIRDALLAQTPRIASVYQSQRDSVFSSSIIAADIYHLLCAMDDVNNKNLLKKAMATLLYRGFGVDFSDLDAIDADDGNADAVFEQKIAEFTECRDCWERYGVLAALNRLVQQQKLMEQIARLPDCDRLVTDLRHLGELLQNKSLECSSREQLIIWFGRQLQDDSDIDEDSKRLRLESDENLVKIVTIHVSKGLEYGIVFLPFFFMPWLADSQKNLPLYHPEPDYHSRVDFSASGDELDAAIQKEMLAEDMRLLYVAITRAIYQCYIGISAAVKGKAKTPLFPNSVWAHLLELSDQEKPDWAVIKIALENKLSETASSVQYQTLFDSSVNRKAEIVSKIPAIELVAQVIMPEYQRSNWIITSYSALAHARKDPGLQRGGADEAASSLMDSDNEFFAIDDAKWTNNIRYRLKGSARTGDCLHDFFEGLAKSPDDMSLLQTCLRKHGLEKPEGFNPAGATYEERDAIYAERCKEIGGWLDTVLDSRLIPEHSDSTLRELFLQGSVLPEMSFDFSIGTISLAKIKNGINNILSSLDISGVSVPYQSDIKGLITGSIDLFFIHKNKMYILDYKSNTLGRSPRFYDNAHMSEAMKAQRFDLQYLIYSVAAHRYMQQRLGERYDFDQGEYSFGGVFYLFLRGIGLPEYPGHGVWFHRPEKYAIEALDAALTGKEVAHG